MDDRQIAAEINHLVETEHRLERAHIGQGLSEAEIQQLRTVEVQLDQCWDLLRQRRARRATGLDPDLPHVPSKNLMPVGTAMRKLVKAKKGSSTAPVAIMWCADTTTDNGAAEKEQPVGEGVAPREGHVG